MKKLHALATATLAVAAWICSSSLAQAAAPTLSAISPASGPASTSVLLTGTEFTGIVSNVKFGNTATSFTINSPTSITAIAPVGGGTVNVTVTTAQGTSNGLPFTYGTTTPPTNPPGKVTVGPGSSIFSDNGPPLGSFCTVGAVGRDDFNRLVAITAGHCVTRGHQHQEVYLTGTAVTPHTLIGTYETIATDWPGFPETEFPKDSTRDYAVILLDEEVVNPINTAPDGTRFDSLHLAPPVPLQDIMCKYGQATGLTCGLVFQFEDNVIRSWAAQFPGDSGGGVVINGGFAGVNSAINPLTVLPPGAPFQFTGIIGILEDIEAQGPSTVGIGFEPLP